MLKKIYYSCVVDASALFVYQTWNLVNSLIENAIVEPSSIFVHYTKEVDTTFIDELLSLGINVVPLSRFGDGKYCNKIAQLRTPEFSNAECVFLLDADMIVLGELHEAYTPNAISGKVVDLANPDLSILKQLFDLAGFKEYPAICNVDCGVEQTFHNNLNGGLYVVPGRFIKELSGSWEKWALWLLEKIDILTAVGKQNHVDQISFSLATHDLAFPVSNISEKFNYPVHLPIKKMGYPTILHYHRNLSKVGMIEVEGECDIEFNRAIHDANNLIGSCFNNKVFWSFRYLMFPELGSGIGSREENMVYKRQLLQQLGIEDCTSILDVGCGDIEVIRTLNLQGYTGVDISPEAIKIAKEKRPDLDFILLEGEGGFNIPEADTVLCLEVLIHQQNIDDYQNLINLLAARTKRRLIVSGYTSKQLHHDTNHMLKYFESVFDSLMGTKVFSKITKIGCHSDVDIFLAEI